jgi:hypothetical protein
VCFSDIWKTAEIIPIEKIKNVSSESDFSPISLLWHMGKVLEKAVMHFYEQIVLPNIKMAISWPIKRVKALLMLSLWLWINGLLP